MTIRPHSRSRIRTRAAEITIRRLSPCYRHPDDPVTGICASCLRERLSSLDASATAISGSPELRRCRSVVSSSKCEASSSSLNEPRRKSCDVFSTRSSLSNLFGVDDLKSGSESDAKVESKNVGLSRVSYTVIESQKNIPDRIRVSGDGFGGLDGDCADRDEEVEEGEFKSMKEYIDLEFGIKSKKSKDLKEIAGNIWGAASVFSKKLRKWRQKTSKIKENTSVGSNNVVSVNNGNRKLSNAGRKLEENFSETVGRRSCDIEPRFSVDGGRNSFEEPRASWDGYMIARTIPRLTPMFSVVENGILGNAGRFENHRLSVDDGPMRSIIENESSSGALGSDHSNSDSSSSMRRSSFDRSSSVRSLGMKGSSSVDHGISPANVKLVITEKELKDWHLSSSKNDELEKLKSTPRNIPKAEDAGSLNVTAKKSVRQRVCNVLGFKNKNRKSVCEAFKEDAEQGKGVGELLRTVGDWKLDRSSSVVASRKSCDVPGSYYSRRRSVDNAGGFTINEKEDFKLERNRSAKFSSVDLDNGVTPFYMTPLRSLRNSKSGKLKIELQSSHPIAGNIQ